MNNFEFFNPVRVIFGRGEFGKAGAEAKKLGKKAVIVSYKGNSFNGELFDKLHSMLSNEGVAFTDFMEVTANPTIGQARMGVDLCKNVGADLVIGVGGGSAMDCAKVIAAGVKYPNEDLWKMIVSRHNENTAILPTESLPTLMIPTLPATGSEMNYTAVITNETTLEKSYVWAPCLYPKTSILDPELTVTLPAYQTACGAADTISHVLESYLNSPGNTPVQDGFQESIIKTVMQNVEKVLKDPNDIETRAVMQWCATVALNGWAQAGSYGWAPMHQLGHVLSARYDMTHGATLSVVMCAWLKYVYRFDPGRYLLFAKNIFGISAEGKTDQEVILEAADKFEKFINKIGVKTKLSEYGINKSDIDGLVDDVVKISFGQNGKLGSNPPVSKEDVKKVFNMAL